MGADAHNLVFANTYPGNTPRATGEAGLISPEEGVAQNHDHIHLCSRWQVFSPSEVSNVCMHGARVIHHTTVANPNQVKINYNSGGAHGEVEVECHI